MESNVTPTTKFESGSKSWKTINYKTFMIILAVIFAIMFIVLWHKIKPSDEPESKVCLTESCVKASEFTVKSVC